MNKINGDTMAETSRKLKLSVLLVEDDDIDRKALNRPFKRHAIDCTITEARDGIEALDILNGEHQQVSLTLPYVILLDLNMPRMGGIEFLRELRSEAMPQSIRNSIVFVLTTSAAEQDRQGAYDHHVAGYMVKPDYSEGLSKNRQTADGIRPDGGVSSNAPPTWFCMKLRRGQTALGAYRDAYRCAHDIKRQKCPGWHEYRDCPLPRRWRNTGNAFPGCLRSDVSKKDRQPPLPAGRHQPLNRT